jgi:hypothetical protein
LDKERFKKSRNISQDRTLTFLNIPQLERQGADLQSKVDELEALNQTMRDRDKLKVDAITHLSDQVIALTAPLGCSPADQSGC